MIAYSYDPDGNLTEKNDPSEASPIAYEWDSRDRLIGQTGGPEGPVSFLYDSDGNRVEKTVGTGPTAKTTRFLRISWHSGGSGFIDPINRQAIFRLEPHGEGASKTLFP